MRFLSRVRRFIVVVGRVDYRSFSLLEKVLRTALDGGFVFFFFGCFIGLFFLIFVRCGVARV